METYEHIQFIGILNMLLPIESLSYFSFDPSIVSLMHILALSYTLSLFKIFCLYHCMVWNDAWFSKFWIAWDLCYINFYHGNEAKVEGSKLFYAFYWLNEVCPKLWYHLVATIILYETKRLRISSCLDKGFMLVEEGTNYPTSHHRIILQ